MAAVVRNGKPYGKTLLPRLSCVDDFWPIQADLKIDTAPTLSSAHRHRVHACASVFSRI